MNKGAVLALLSRIRIAAVYGRAKLKESLAEVQSSDVFQALPMQEKLFVVGYASGRIDAYDAPSGSVSAAALRPLSDFKLLPSNN